MASFKTVYLRSSIRRRLAWFLGERSPWRPPLISALRGLGGDIPICLFGGVVRDLAIFGRAANPVDIDLVVGGFSVGELEEVLHAFVVRRTSFGGLKLSVAGTSVDIWPLHETWAFRATREIEPSFSALPATTFLNVEAIAIELVDDCLRAGHIYSKGFFESVSRRVIDINYPSNPFPRKAVGRSLALARRIGFSVGPSLAGRAAELLENCSLQVLPDESDTVMGCSVGWR